MNKKIIKDIISNFYLLTIVLGGLIFFSFLLKRGDLIRSRNRCDKVNIINKLSCKTSETADLVFRELNNIRFLFPGRRLEYFEGFEKYKNLSTGFKFNYPKNSNKVKGFLLLSKYNGDNFKPAIELWDLKSQQKVHSWEINLDKLLNEMTMEDRSKIRLKHPVLLNDGSIITIPTNSNAPVLRFDMCGNIEKINTDYWYHHSIEVDQEGLIYIPIANSKLKNPFYKNYEKFKGSKKLGKDIIYRDEAISILDKNLNIKEIIPLDQIFYSLGLLHDVNSPLNKDWSDPYHLNDIHPFVNKLGERILYLSMRNYGLISYNLSKNKVEWVIRGIADLQHDITPIPDRENSVSIFDNGVEKNTPMGTFRGNSLIEIKFPKTNFTKFYLGRNVEEQGLSQNRIYFNNLPKNFVPNTTTQGRGRFLKNGNIYIEATNQGKLFEYDPLNKKLLWSFLNKAKSGKIYMLGWSRYYEEIPEGLEIKKLKACEKK